MGVSPKSNARNQGRSISLPCRSDSKSTDTIEKVLSTMKAWERSSLLSTKPSAEDICSGFSQLARLYECMDDLFNSSLTHKTHHQNEKWVEELLERSVRFLDICSVIRDILSQMKDHSTDLQCALRRRKGGSTIESSISKYNSFRTKTKKDIKGLFKHLKQPQNNIINHSQNEDSENHNHVAVIRLAREVASSSISFFHSVLMFFNVPVLKSRPTSRWSVTIRKSKGAVAPVETVGLKVNEMQNLDAALFRHHKIEQGENDQIVKDRLEAFDVCVNDIEAGLESLYRRLIATRASVLNMVSSY